MSFYHYLEVGHPEHQSSKYITIWKVQNLNLIETLSRIPNFSQILQIDKQLKL